MPFVYKENILIGYDDTESIEHKLNYTIEKNLGGVAVWSLDFEDTDGNACAQGEFPLLTRIYQTLALHSSNECNKISSTLKSPIRYTARFTSSYNASLTTKTTTTAFKRNLSRFFFRDFLAFRNHSSSTSLLILSKYQLENLIFILSVSYYCFYLNL